MKTSSENTKIQDALDCFSNKKENAINRHAALSTLIENKYLPKNADNGQIQIGRDILITEAKSSKDQSSKLIAIAELIRLGKVVKRLSDDLPELFRLAYRNELPDFTDSEYKLDADVRVNIARACSFIESNWIQAYRAKIIANEETADRVRAEMLSAFIPASNSLTEALTLLKESFNEIKVETESPGDTIARRLTRVIALLRPIILETDIDIGNDIGKALLNFIREPLIHSKPQETAVQIGLAKEMLYLVHDIVRTNMSVVTDPHVYDVVAYCRRLLGEKTWPPALREPLECLIRDIREALILLGRQGQSDQNLMDQLKVLCNYPERAKNILQRIADKHPEIPEDVRYWFTKGRKKTVAAPTVGDTALSMKDASTDGSIGDVLLQTKNIQLQITNISNQLLTSLNIFDPGLVNPTQDLFNSFKVLLIQVGNIAKLRRLGIYGDIGTDIEMMPKFFDVIGGNPRQIMTVVKPAIVILRDDGSIGDVITKGIVK